MAFLGSCMSARRLVVGPLSCPAAPPVAHCRPCPGNRCTAHPQALQQQTSQPLLRVQAGGGGLLGVRLPALPSPRGGHSRRGFVPSVLLTSCPPTACPPNPLNVLGGRKPACAPAAPWPHGGGAQPPPSRTPDPGLRHCQGRALPPTLACAMSLGTPNLNPRDRQRALPCPSPAGQFAGWRGWGAALGSAAGREAGGLGSLL